MSVQAITDPYLALMSIRATSCEMPDRSKTASSATRTPKPLDVPSTAVARMHPDVVHPVSTIVRWPFFVRNDCRGVLKNADAFTFGITTSFGFGRASAMNSLER